MKYINACIVVYCLFLLFSCGNNQDNSQNVTTGAIDGVASQVNKKVKKQKINKSNLVIKEWNTDVHSNTRILDHVTTYNVDGQKIEEIEYNSEGQKWRKRFEYDVNGNKTKEAVYDGHNRLVNVKKFEYNEFGKKTITYTYNARGTLTAIKNYEYLTQ